MAITLKRQLDDNEKQKILERHGRGCFATGHPIAQGEALHFDHIRAFAHDGPSELDNIAPMCEMHNKQKGTLPLEDFRVSLRLKQFFSEGDGLTLRHLLAHLQKNKDLKNFGQQVAVHQANGEAVIETGSEKFACAVHKCPTTGWQYFYATLPVEILNSDDEDEERIGLQPRYLVFDKVFALYRHFLRHPVLQPSIGRVNKNHIVIFDGQHKIAALLWTGRRSFECKIYIEPQLRLLNETNIAAHDTFSQMRFFASVMVARLGSEFGADFEKYKNLEDGAIKSEAGFMKYLDRVDGQALTRAERNKRFRSYLYNSVLQSQENKLSNYVSKGNRSSDEKPLTIDVLTKSIFSSFLYTQPVEDNMATDAYKRDKEIDNVVALMNMIHDLALGFWNPKVGKNDETQRRLMRLFGSKSMMSWSELLKDAICARLEIFSEEDRVRPFYRELSPIEQGKIKTILSRLVNFKIWKSPSDSEVDRVLSDNKSAVKDWLKKQGLDIGYLLGASQ
ncbi:MAG: hypothetical protein A3H27_15345 [Acidobacteria bacterium RIFCSPLOWO2_02_FULL_59_13]|nr:MAG: hypothetical protein A3H27_15345 [Acidobacteria bacterium RIFCSPLOWO2_02_FULL_59_13]